MDDLFDTMTDEQPEPDESDTSDETEADTNGEAEETEESAEAETDDRPTVSEIPEGAMSVTDFAALLTLTEGNPYGYVVPQSVYQAVKAKNNPLPHVLVKTEDDNQPRVYVLRDEALAAWVDRASRLETRGSGAGKPASKRTPEELKEAFSKEDGAVWKSLYADSRRALWDGILEDREKTVDKYARWMKEAGVSADEINDLKASVKEAFDAAEQAKVEEREAKAKAAKEARDAAKATNGTTVPANA